MSYKADITLITGEVVTKTGFLADVEGNDYVSAAINSVLVKADGTVIPGKAIAFGKVSEE